MERTFYEDLRDLIATGRRFNHEEIAMIKTWQEYQHSSSTERAFIDVLLNSFEDLPPHIIPEVQRTPAMATKSPPDQ